MYHIYYVLALFLGLTSGATAQDDTPIDWKVVADPGPTRPAWQVALPYKQLNHVQPRKLLYPYGLTTFVMTSYKRDNNDMSDNVIVGDLLCLFSKPKSLTTTGFSSRTIFRRLRYARSSGEFIVQSQPDCINWR